MSKVVLDNVSKVFIGQSGPVQALTDFSLAIAEGEFLCVVGPSGGGKSTLLNLIAGLDRADQGRILVDGRPVVGPGTDRVVMFQEAALFPWLTVSQNVGFGLKMAGMDKQKRQQRVAELLETVGLASFASAWVHELSGGMKQRAALAMALAPDPGILLMDEPFAALDAQTRDQLHEEIEAIWEATGKTIIFVTHNVREAVRLGSRVILLTARQGRIRQEYPVDLPRHRHLEDVEVVKIASVIRDDLKLEVQRAAAGGSDV
jgi:NitT/TauT family transport system ATP-binding protein